MLRHLERDHRPASADERDTLARFPGFGAVALSIFPNPATGHFKDAGWQTLGEELRALLTDEEYASARRTTFNAFYTSPIVIRAMHHALDRLGVPADGLVLEPGCGTGNFLAQAPTNMRFLAVEQDGISGAVATSRFPNQDVRVEDFADTRLPPGGLDAVIGNVPFADVRLDYHGQKFALHDYFFAKAIDGLAPGGVLALVTSRYTLDKQNAAVREYLGDRADFLGAIRLPSDAFKREGTQVVADIVFLRKRAPGDPPAHADPDWQTTAPLDVDGLTAPVNRYFRNHPEMVLGRWSRKDTLYGDGLSVVPNGILTEQLHAAVERLPQLPHRESVIPQSALSVRSFVTPPEEPHVTEGSFVILPDRQIGRVVERRVEPVVYGGVSLRANGTLVGRRLAALVRLRDDARRVLRSQNEGWPAEYRDDARSTLNRDYDAFVHHYGPVNKTTIHPTSDGTLVRRMPNLVKFREDPDAMLVMALEEYDEETGTARKAPILGRDVVGPTPPVESVGSAEDGLLVALDRTGTVDLPLIARLYGKGERDVIDELGDLVYRDPETRDWQTADVYLSGNVRAKLTAAGAAGPAFSRNADALRAVQPEDVLPGEIDAHLGAPWVPSADVEAFAADLLGVPGGSVQVAHLARDAVWSVEGNYAAQQSVAATTEFGTDRVNALSLLELALNQKTRVVTDPVPGTDQRAANPEATLAAREKQKRLKERFRTWVFAEPDRTERLVRVYNDTYNNLRPRRFDGSHLAFPGMSQGITLQPHQVDAVWRGMSSGNTLLAHAVGAGKTFTMAATGMKLRQAGLARKPMYVVPNHMLEQFAREFLQLYPNAKLLVAGKDDFTRDRRKLLTARIAGGDWDGIVVTHSGFERIGMSRDYQARFLRDQITEYDELLSHSAAADPSKARRNIVKTIEKQKARREARLKDLLAADKKDDGLVFDDLGVDHVFVDEAHYFKNLETPTKMDRVAGIPAAGRSGRSTCS